VIFSGSFSPARSLILGHRNNERAMTSKCNNLLIIPTVPQASRPCSRFDLLISAPMPISTMDVSLRNLPFRLGWMAPTDNSESYGYTQGRTRLAKLVVKAATTERRGRFGCLPGEFLHGRTSSCTTFCGSANPVILPQHIRATSFS